jgi:hypothetical protein
LQPLLWLEETAFEIACKGEESRQESIIIV